MDYKDKILNDLYNKGFYKIKNNIYSNFSKIICGIVWCITYSKRFKLKLNFKIKENKLENLEYKIRMAEKIHNYLLRVKSPIILLPHQISGLDYENIYKLIIFLLDHFEVKNNNNSKILIELDWGLNSSTNLIDNFRNLELNYKFDINEKKKKFLKNFHPIKMLIFLIKNENYDYVDNYINIIKNDKIFEKIKDKLLSIIDKNKIKETNLYNFNNKNTLIFIQKLNQNHKNIINLFKQENQNKKLVKLKENISTLKKSNNLIIKELESNPIVENIDIPEVLKMYKNYKNIKMEILEKRRNAIELRSQTSKQYKLIKNDIKYYSKHNEFSKNQEKILKYNNNLDELKIKKKTNFENYISVVHKFMDNYETVNTSTDKIKNLEKKLKYINNINMINSEIFKIIKEILKILKPKKYNEINNLLKVFFTIVDKNLEIINN